MIDQGRVAVVGYGQEGQAAVQYLARYYPHLELEILDQNPVQAPYHVISGPDYLDGVNQYDLVIKSPGIAFSDQLTAQLGAKLSSGTALFLEQWALRQQGGTLIGVSGSKGKSTTASLIAFVLEAAGKPVLLAGNIGQPMLSEVDKLSRPGLIVVLELSSYQLQDSAPKPDIAVLTSLFPEHLNYHGSLERYYAAKQRLFCFQSSEQRLFYHQDPACQALVKDAHAQATPFQAADSPVLLNQTQLIGAHNLSNLAAAWKVAEQFGVDLADYIQAVSQFKPLPHRLQDLGVVAGRRWIDDAISTAPESTLAALEAVDGQVGCLFLGGQDRGLNFADLGQEIAQRQIPAVVLFPESGAKIKPAILQAGWEPSWLETSSMTEAVQFAAKQAPAGSICLLSTASPSYGIFKGFIDKGEQFMAAVANLEGR